MMGADTAKQDFRKPMERLVLCKDGSLLPVEVSFAHWREDQHTSISIFLRDIRDRQRLEQAVDAMVHSQPWRDAVVRFKWIDRYLAGEPFARFVDSEEARVKDILRKFGTQQGESTLASAGPYPLFVLAGLLIFGFVAVIDVQIGRAHV